MGYNIIQKVTMKFWNNTLKYVKLDNYLFIIILSFGIKSNYLKQSSYFVQ
jgi:hypothetical protein